MDLLDQSETDHLRCHPGRQRGVGVQRTVRQIGNAVGRLAQRQRGAVAERHRHFFVGDRHPAFAGKAGHGEILQLAAVYGIREIQRLPVGQRLLFLFARGRPRQPKEHGGRVGPAFRRMPAAVFQMTALAGTRIEQRPQPVRGLRRGRRGDPQLAEKRVAELEGTFFLECQIGRRVREGILVDTLARRGRAALHGLELLGFRKIRSRSSDGGDPRLIFGGKVGSGGREAGWLRGAGERGASCQNKAQEGGDQGSKQRMDMCVLRGSLRSHLRMRSV